MERGISDCVLGIREYANISLFHNKIENLCSTYRARWFAWNSIVHAIYSCGVNSLPVSQPAHHTPYTPQSSQRDFNFMHP